MPDKRSRACAGRARWAALLRGATPWVQGAPRTPGPHASPAGVLAARGPPGARHCTGAERASPRTAYTCAHPPAGHPWKHANSAPRSRHPAALPHSPSCSLAGPGSPGPANWGAHTHPPPQPVRLEPAARRKAARRGGSSARWRHKCGPAGTCGAGCVAQVPRGLARSAGDPAAPASLRDSPAARSWGARQCRQPRPRAQPPRNPRSRPPSPGKAPELSRRKAGAGGDAQARRPSGSRGAPAYLEVLEEGGDARDLQAEAPGGAAGALDAPGRQRLVQPPRRRRRAGPGRQGARRGGQPHAQGERRAGRPGHHGCRRARAEAPAPRRGRAAAATPLESSSLHPRPPRAPRRPEGRGEGDRRRAIGCEASERQGGRAEGRGQVRGAASRAPGASAAPSRPPRAPVPHGPPALLPPPPRPAGR